MQKLTAIIVEILMFFPLANAAVTIDSILYQLDPRTVTYFIVFLVAFSLIYFSLNRVFGENRVIPAIIAFALSFGIIYALFQSNYRIEDIWYNFFNFNEGTVVYIGLLAILALFILICFKVGFGEALIVTGALILVASFTQLVYEKGAGAFLGALFLFIGFGVKYLFPKKKSKLEQLLK